MNKTLLFLVLLTTAVCEGWAQQKEASILILSRNRLGKETVVDTSDVRIYYALNAVCRPAGAGSRLESDQVQQ